MAAIERFIDAKDDLVQYSPHIVDYKNDTIVPLEEALSSIKKYTRKISDMVSNAKRKASESRHDSLTIDEAAAIRLFTMEQTSTKNNICIQLNQILRSEDKNQLDSWFNYYRLLSMALNKLPSISCTVYRGARGDLRKYYQQDYICWWGFSFCLKSPTDIDKYLGKKGIRTVFQIECINGKSVSEFSYLRDENEVILMPYIYLKVLGMHDLGNGLYLIGLQEELLPNDLTLSIEKQSSTITKENSSNEDDDDDELSAQSHKTNKLSKVHPACQFQARLQWFECQFHENDKGSIIKPDKFEMIMEDPREKSEADIINRIHGSIIGMSLGDALGAHVEFRPREYLLQNPVKDLQGGGTWGLEKGQFTDDTSMALCLACSLILRRDFVPYDQLVRYKWWYKHGYMSSTGVCFDIGAATLQSISEFERRQKRFSQKYNIPMDHLDYLSDCELLNKFNVFCSTDGVAGNGALMRLAPVPLFFYRHPQYAVEFSGQSGMITHGDQKAYDACRYYGALIVAALNGESKDELLDDDFYVKHKTWFNNKPLTATIMEIAQGSYKRKSGYEEGIRGKGYIVNALEAALWAFYNDKNSFKKGALAAVNLGDDTDTTAAIYGQLAGAYYGFENLPGKWVNKIYAKEFLMCLSKWIIYEGQQWQPDRSISTHFISSPFQTDDSLDLSCSQDTNINLNPDQKCDIELPTEDESSQKQKTANKDQSHRKPPVANRTEDSVTPRINSNSISRRTIGYFRSMRFPRSKQQSSKINNERPRSASKSRKSEAKS